MSPPPAEVRQAVLRWAVTDPETIGRYRAKVVTVPGSGCQWWTGALSGRGRGRFWLASLGGQDVVVVAHHFGFGLANGSAELAAVRVLGHRCDKPLCQRVGPGRVVRWSPVRNRRERAARRALAGGALTDRRGSRGRANAVWAPCAAPATAPG